MGQGEEVIYLSNGCQFFFNHNLQNFFFLNITEPAYVYVYRYWTQNRTSRDDILNICSPL